MTCRVCGRGACTESFHSLAEQEEADRRRDDKYGTDDESDTDSESKADV